VNEGAVPGERKRWKGLKTEVKVKRVFGSII